MSEKTNKPDRKGMTENEEFKRLFGYLRYNSYRSGRYRLFYIATPKVACTTLKWWFAAIEGHAGEIRAMTDSRESDPDLVIHDTFHRVAPGVTGLMPDALSEVLASDSYFRFALVSNPYRRIFSAWQSKLLLKEPLQSGPYLDCEFFNHPVEHKGDIGAAFEGFLEHLASSEAPDYLDFHWTPQAILLRPDLVDYAMLARIEDPEELGRELTERTGGQFPDPFGGPRLNESLIPYCREFLTERSSELIRSLYAGDFKTFGYDDRPPVSKKVFTDDQFELVRKAILLVRGRHKQLDDRYVRIVQLDRQLADKEKAVREKEISWIQQKEELLRKDEELNQRTGEINRQTEALKQATEELERKNEELIQKNEELIQKSEELSSQTGKLRQKSEELSQVRSELEEKRSEISRQKEELDGKTQELRQKALELGRVRTELKQKSDDITRKTGEIGQKNAEIAQKRFELEEKVEELVRKTAELDQMTEQLDLKTAELEQRTEQLNQLLNSRTWVLTRPVRVVLDIPVRIVGKISRHFSVTASIIRLNGGIINTLVKTVNVLRKEGIGRIPHHYGVQKSLAGKQAEPARHEPLQGVPRTGEFLPRLHDAVLTGDETAFRDSSSILFIGHDARLAGAQVLLLSLIQWFSRHTGIIIKIILLQDGVLVEKFRNIAPTLIWEEFLRKHPDKDKRCSLLADFTGKVDLVYGNTVLSPAIYDELEFLKAPFITHVHELERSIRLYAGKSAIEKMHSHTDGYIACSDPVAVNLAVNHGIEMDRIVTIHEFIEDRKLKLPVPKKDLRRKSGLDKNGIIVIGCGTFYWRKGGDLFIETALKLKEQGFSDFHFYWIGENIWDDDAASFRISSWVKLEQRIRENGLGDHITFLGVKDDVFEFLQAGDVFYLPSREDPFPLVCLEAAQCGLPVICFEEAGGMPAFVENDAGFVVPFEDIEAAADKIRLLHQDPSLLGRLGETARIKFLQRHSIGANAPGILGFCRKVGGLPPAVSVIVPNYNCEKFLVKRMESIINQTFRDLEVIILDDASADNSLEIIGNYLHLPDVRLIKNNANSGNPFIQWHKGFGEARGGIIWFAEADDFCEPGFLQKILPFFNDPSVAMAYCDSAIIDENDNVTGDYGNYYMSLDPHHWRSSYKVSGVREINFGLGVKNSIPNASAVLIRKSCIPEAAVNQSRQYKFSGDWYLYTRVLRGRQIAFHPEQMNYHRKHGQTVTSSFNTDKVTLLLKEAGSIHQDILCDYPIAEDFLKKWDYYITEQIRAFYPDAKKEEFDKYYPYTLVEERIRDAIIRSRNSKKLVFLTTNDGTPDGGSEQLWRKAAIECSRRGHDVMVVIKQWDPEPFFLKDLRDAGIAVIFKEADHYAHIREFGPDLVILSLGDQDEGLGYYELCRISRIPYVIVNQLTKEPKYWPVDRSINDKVKEGYLGAEIVLFTGNNNREVMERRLGCKIPKAGIFFNPYDVDPGTEIPFPPIDKGIKIAMVGNLLRIHKGQHLALELFSMKKWRERPLHLNIYGKGDDESALKKQAADYKMTNVTFHGHADDILGVWKENQAILMPSFMEGLPLALVGALICARVPVVTDIGAHREIIDDNASGFIASEPAVEALDEALERAFKRSAEWEEIGLKARQGILNILPGDPVGHFIGMLIPFFDKRQRSAGHP